MTIQERILQLLEKKEVTPYKFCKDLGFSMGYLDKRGAIGTDKYLKIIKYFPEISSMWLLSGEGDMLKSELNEQKFSNNDKYTASLEKINALQEDKIANLEKTIKELNNKLQKTIAKQENDIINLQGEDLSAMKSPNLPPDDPLQPSRRV
jgi:putative phage repressor